MKIVYVTSTLPFGHAEAFIIPEIIQLMHLGHEVFVVPMNPRGNVVHTDASAFVDNTLGVPLLSWDVVGRALGQLFLKPWTALRLLFEILRATGLRKKLKNLAVYPKGLWLANLAQRLGVEHIHAHWAATTGTMAMIASELSGVPWSFTAHRWDIVENNLLQRKMNTASLARFISQGGLDTAKTMCSMTHKAKVEVLHMGIPIVQSSAVATYDSKLPFIILIPANLVPVKGHKFLIEAVAQLRDSSMNVMLRIAGQGELRAGLEDQVRRLGLEERVQFLGQVSHDEILDMYAKKTVQAVVLPSLDLGNGVHEGIPVSLIEAMSYGIPVVSTRTGGIPELLHDGAGLLVPDRNATSLADAIKLLMTCPALQTELSAQGRARVDSQFNVAFVVERLLHYFHQAG